MIFQLIIKKSVFHLIRIISEKIIISIVKSHQITKTEINSLSVSSLKGRVSKVLGNFLNYIKR